VAAVRARGTLTRGVVVPKQQGCRVEEGLGAAHSTRQRLGESMAKWLPVNGGWSVSMGGGGRICLLWWLSPRLL
jgi:hypothetical protein